MELDGGNAALSEMVKKIGNSSMWSGLHDHKKKCEGWAAFGSLAGSNLGLRGVFRDCRPSLQAASPLQGKRCNFLISNKKRSLDKWALPRADPQTAHGDTNQATCLGCCCNGDGLQVVTTGTWGVVALVGESWTALGYLVLKEQWRTRGNGDLGSFQGFLMNAVRKMEKITFLRLFYGAQDIERMLQKGSVIWNTPDAK